MSGGLLRKRIHGSWMVACACVGIVCGTGLALQLPMFGTIAWLLTGIALCLAAMMSGRVALIPIVIAGGMTVGLWRGSSVQSDLAYYANLIGTTRTVQGTVKEDVDTNKRNQLVLRLKDLSIDGKHVAGTLWVTTSDKPGIRRSDIVTVRGKLAEGFGGFSASIYGARIESSRRPVPGDVALELRDRFAGGVRAAISDPEASLGLGYVVGQRRGLPEELDIALQAAGLTHIVVASGYNLTILVRIARRLFEKISKYLSFVAASSMIIGFIAITGASPSMSRAGLVAGLSLVAWYYGRRFHPLVLLPLAMAVTLLIEPSYAWGDLGWQLSFAAFAGVMILAPLLNAYYFGDKKENALRRIFVETMSATIATMPIIFYSFGQLSVVAPIANMLILPLVPLAMVLTFVAGVGGLIAPVVATVIGLPAETLLNYMTTTATFMGSIPWAVQEIRLPILGMIAAYLGIAGCCVYLQRATKFSLRSSSIVE